MADDEVHPPLPPRDTTALRNRGRRRDPATIDGTAEEVGAEPGDGDGATDAVSAAEPDPVLAGAASVPPDVPVVAGGEPAADDPPRESEAARGEPADLSGPPSDPPPTPAGEPPRVEPAQPRRSLLPPILVGLGVILVALLGGVLYELNNPSPDPTVTALTGQVNGLAGRVSALEAKAPPPPVNLKPLADRVAAMEGKASAATPQPAPDLKPLGDRIAALEATAAQLKSDLGDATGKLNQLAASQASAGQTAPQPAAAPAPPVDLGPLQKQVAELSDGLKSLGDKVAALAPGDLGPVKDQVATVSEGLKSLTGRVDALPKVDLAPLGGRLDALDGKLAGVAAAVAALPRVDLGPLDAKVDAIDHRLAPVEAALAAPKAGAQVTEARQNGSAAETRAPPLAVTGQAILDDIDAGRPFGPAVAALAALGADGGALAPLKAVAERGAPTRADLLATFEDHQRDLAGAGAPPQGGGVLDRMVAGAQNLVKVRPAGAAPEKDPDAVVSRIGGDLRTGDDAAALSEWGNLPEDGRAAGREFGDKLRARVEAEAAARRIVADAIASLGASGAVR